MKAGTRLWLAVVVAAVAGSAVGAGAVWLAQRSDIEGSKQELVRLEGEVDRLQSELDEQKRQAEQTPQPPAGSSVLTDTAPNPNAPKKVREFAFIRRLEYGSPGKLVADYAQFLTGDKAAEAAEKAGEESPPPNDYFIVNENPKLRTLKVASNARVRLATKPGEGSIADGYSSDVKTLVRYLSQDTEETISLRLNGYWLTIQDGLVIAIEEQYTP